MPLNKFSELGEVLCNILMDATARIFFPRSAPVLPVRFACYGKSVVAVSALVIKTNFRANAEFFAALGVFFPSSRFSLALCEC